MREYDTDAKASRIEGVERAPMEAGWSTITRTVPNFALSLSNTAVKTWIAPPCNVKKKTLVVLAPRKGDMSIGRQNS